jgi:hypothetical protein
MPAGIDMTRSIEYVGAGLLAIALLLPVGDAPWFSFWREWTACIAVLLVVLGTLSTLRQHGVRLRMRGQVLASTAIALAVVGWVQYLCGLLPYRSDAFMPSLYLLAFAACVIAASSLPDTQREELGDRLALALMVPALVSAPMAVLQWIGWLNLELGMRVAGGRPVAHMEQANLLCSLEIIGALSVWRLQARGRMPTWVAMVFAAPLLVAVALTQSRVAWVVALAVIAVTWWRRDLFEYRLTRIVLPALASLVVATQLVLPWFNARLGLTGPALAERMSEGRRPAAWSLYLDAAVEKPAFGWGVLQNGVAQSDLAEKHESLGYFFSSAHSLAIDLMVWYGIPLGLFSLGVLLWTVWRRIAYAPEVATLAGVMVVVALTLHGLVELPLQYAYFLLPLGLFIGLTTTDKRIFRAPAHPIQVGRLIAPLALGTTLLLAWIAREYIALKDVRPILAIDKTTSRLKLEAYVPAPDVALLDQLEAFHAFAAFPLGPALQPAELEAARRATMRLPYAASIERYALLAGLSGYAEESQQALLRVCKFENAVQCGATIDAWLTWRQQWPRLPMWPIVDDPS